MSQSDTSLYGETEFDMDPGVARCDLCGLTTDHQHSWEEWGFTLEAGPFDGPEALPAPDEAEMDDMERCYCRRCLLHDDPGGCLRRQPADQELLDALAAAPDHDWTVA